MARGVFALLEARPISGGANHGWDLRLRIDVGIASYSQRLSSETLFMIDKANPVLIADDDEYFRLALTALLRGPLGFERVIESASLDEAIDRLANSGESISLALFDLRMPG